MLRAVSTASAATVARSSPTRDARLSYHSYNRRMQYLHLHGTYRYASPEDLSAAIQRARSRLAVDDGIAMRCFVYDHTVLTVNLSFASAASAWIPLFETLAANALEGSWAMGR